MQRREGWNEYDPYSSPDLSNIHNPPGYYDSSEDVARAGMERRSAYLLNLPLDSDARARKTDMPQLHVSFVTHRMSMVIDTARIMHDIKFYCPTAISFDMKKQQVDEVHCSQSGYGFVAFPTAEDCFAARQKLKKLSINGLTYDCELAHRSFKRQDKAGQRHQNYPIAPTSQYPPRVLPSSSSIAPYSAAFQGPSSAHYEEMRAYTNPAPRLDYRSRYPTTYASYPSDSSSEQHLFSSHHLDWAPYRGHVTANTPSSNNSHSCARPAAAPLTNTTTAQYAPPRPYYHHNLSKYNSFNQHEVSGEGRMQNPGQNDNQNTHADSSYAPSSSASLDAADILSQLSLDDVRNFYPHGRDAYGFK